MKYITGWWGYLASCNIVTISVDTIHLFYPQTYDNPVFEYSTAGISWFLQGMYIGAALYMLVEAYLDRWTSKLSKVTSTLT